MTISSWCGRQTEITSTRQTTLISMCSSKPRLYHFDFSIHMPKTLALSDIRGFEKNKNCHFSWFLILILEMAISPSVAQCTQWQPIKYKKSFSTRNRGFERIAIYNQMIKHRIIPRYNLCLPPASAGYGHNRYGQTIRSYWILLGLLMHCPI